LGSTGKKSADGSVSQALRRQSNLSKCRVQFNLCRGDEDRMAFRGLTVRNGVGTFFGCTPKNPPPHHLYSGPLTPNPSPSRGEGSRSFWIACTYSSPGPPFCLPPLAPHLFIAVAEGPDFGEPQSSRAEGEKVDRFTSATQSALTLISCQRNDIPPPKKLLLNYMPFLWHNPARVTRHSRYRKPRTGLRSSTALTFAVRVALSSNLRTCRNELTFAVPTALSPVWPRRWRRT
jgi:hypothetical protein